MRAGFGPPLPSPPTACNLHDVTSGCTARFVMAGRGLGRGDTCMTTRTEDDMAGLTDQVAEQVLNEVLQDPEFRRVAGIYAGRKGIIDDAAVVPFKKLLADDINKFTDAMLAWMPNLNALPTDIKFSVLSAFYSGQLHERGYRPGDDPNAPPPVRDGK